VSSLTDKEIKEANRYYWIVKGSLIPSSSSEDSVAAIYRSYFVRIWGNDEAYIHETGFEEAWEQRMNNE
jgi:hypothetical protein